MPGYVGIIPAMVCGTAIMIVCAHDITMRMNIVIPDHGSGAWHFANQQQSAYISVIWALFSEQRRHFLRALATSVGQLATIHFC